MPHGKHDKRYTEQQPGGRLRRAHALVVYAAEMATILANQSGRGARVVDFACSAHLACTSEQCRGRETV